MADHLSSLTDEQREHFATMMQQFGREPHQFTHDGTLTPADFGGNLTISADPDKSDIQPVHVPFTSMAHLKQLVGVPDEQYQTAPHADHTVPYPEPLPQDRGAFLRQSQNICDLRYHLTANEHQTLVTAARAYVYGNSDKVKDYEDLLDAHFTPGTLAFFAAATLDIPDGQTVTLAPGGPAVLNFGTITVHGSGQLIVQEQVSVTAQQFIYLPS